MSTSPPTPDPDEVAALRAERDALEQRAIEAEAIAEDLAEQLADARDRLADPSWDESAHLTLFDGAAPAEPGGSLAADGSDQGLLPLALGTTAVVAFLVFVLTLITSGLSFFGVVVLAAAIGFAIAAYQTRFVASSVEIVDGVVAVTHGDDTKRFDLTNDSTKVDVQGQPGDAYWRVRFYRRALDPVDVDVTMVDPADFMRRLREHRPDV